MGRLILETSRLFLREFKEDDAAVFYALWNASTVARDTDDPDDGLRSIDHTAEVLRSHLLADYHAYGFGRWACVLKKSATVVGLSGLKYLPELGEVDIGYRFLPACWGAGLATEAGRAVLGYGFGPVGLRRVIGLVAPENAASARVLEKLGLTPDGVVDYGGMRFSRSIMRAAPSTSRGSLS